MCYKEIGRVTRMLRGILLPSDAVLRLIGRRPVRMPAVLSTQTVQVDTFEL